VDYLKQYIALIHKAQFEERTGYLELHHIVPRCIFGENLLNLNATKDVDQESNLFS